MTIGRNTARLIRKRSKPHPIIRFDRGATTYDEATGFILPLKEEIEYVLAYIKQPIVNKITDGPESQRSIDLKMGWSLELVRNKDKIILQELIDSTNYKSIIYTVSDLKFWEDGNHREFTLTRSGERENIAL